MKDESCLLGYLEHILQAIERIQRYTGDINESAHRTHLDGPRTN